MKTIWKSIADWPHYEVSNDGRVRRVSGKNLTLKKVAHGYHQAALYHEGRKRYVSVHRLVVASFLGPIAPGMQVNHLNGIKHDNRLENLEVTTPSGNALHAVALGLRKSPRGIPRPAHSGELHERAKLTHDAVEEIRTMASAGPINKAELARRYGVSDVLIGMVARRKIWTHPKKPSQANTSSPDTPPREER